MSDVIYHVWRRKKNGHVSAIMATKPWPCVFAQACLFDHLGSFTEWPPARELILAERALQRERVQAEIQARLARKTQA